MSVRSAQSIVKVFNTYNPTTGALSNADSTPAGTLIVNGVNNAASVTVTNRSTGDYKAVVTLPTLAYGDIVELKIAATVSTVDSAVIVWQDTKDIAFDGSGVTRSTDAQGFPIRPLGTSQIIRVSLGGVATYYTPATNTAADRGTSLAAAFTAASSGDTVHLFSDAAVSDQLPIPSGVTFHIHNYATVSNATGSGVGTIGDGLTNSNTAKLIRIIGTGRFTAAGEDSKTFTAYNPGTVIDLECHDVIVTSDTDACFDIRSGAYLKARLTGTASSSGYDVADSSLGGIIDLIARHIVAGDNAIELVGPGGEVRCVSDTIDALGTSTAGIIVSSASAATILSVKSNRITCAAGASGIAIQTLNTTGTPNLSVDCPQIVGTIQADVLSLLGDGVVDSSAVAAPTMTIAGSNVNVVGARTLITKLTETNSLYAATAFNLPVNGTINYNKAKHANVTIVQAKTPATIAAGDVATDAITAASVKADAVTKIQSGIALAAKLLKYIQLLARKDSAIATDNAAEVTEINASGGSGTGAYANTTDSAEATRDRGDAAWVTGAGGGTETITQGGSERITQT